MSTEDERNKKDPKRLFPALSSVDICLVEASGVAVGNTCFKLRGLAHGTGETEITGEMKAATLLDSHFCLQLYMLTRERSLEEKNNLFGGLQRKISEAEETNIEFFKLLRPKVQTYGDEAVAEGGDELQQQSSHASFHVNEIQSLACETIERSVILCRGGDESNLGRDAIDSAVLQVQSSFAARLSVTHDEEVASAIDSLRRKQKWLFDCYDRFLRVCASSEEATEERAALGNQMGLLDAPSCVFMDFVVDHGNC